MTKRPPTNPKSPVQEGGSSGLLPAAILVALLAFTFWGTQQGWHEEPLRAPDLPEQATATSGTPVKARANLAALFTDDDYPAQAIRNEEQGMVAFRLGVSPTGRVEACVVTSSSNSALLDRTTCDILVRRARFQPARDAAGEPVSDTVNGRIKWVLPDA